jgi:hypothetical protein
LREPALRARGLLFNWLFRRHRQAHKEREQQDERGDQSIARINCFTWTPPIRDLPTAQVRLLISQQIGLTEIVPVAPARLEQSPALSGSPDGTGLRESLQRLPAAFWERHPDLHRRWQRMGLE